MSRLHNLSHLRLFSPVAVIIAVASLVSTGTVAADQRRVEMLTNTCIACHGTGGNSTGPAIPSLASLSENYVLAAMLAYKFEGDEVGLDKVVEKLEKIEKYQDLEVHPPRYNTIMSRIAKGYTVEELMMISAVFADREIIRPNQNHDSQKAAMGKRLHKTFCDKCHENEGRMTEDDTGMLAGQWMPYLHTTIEDYYADRRSMPKKMKNKLRDLKKEHGMEGIEALIHYYGSIND